MLLVAGCSEPYDPGFASGSQVAVRWLAASDGTRHFDGWLDRPTGLPCTWIDPGDGVERCLHDGISRITNYRDPACTDGLIDRLARVGYEIRDDRFLAYVPGDAVALTTTYWGSPGDCRAMTSNDPPVRFQPRALLLPDSRFASATDHAFVGEDGDLRAIISLGSDGSRRPLWDAVEVSSNTRCQVVSDDSGGGWCPVGGTRLVDAIRGDARLRWRVLVDPDGDYASPPRGIHDSELGADCWFTPVSDRFLCLPEASASPVRIYSDPVCTESVRGVVVFGVTGAVIDPDGSRVYRLGDTPIINAKVIDPDDGACEYLVNGWSALPIVETLSPDDLVSAILTTDP